ncbi:MAG TPA: hypothetical protein DEE98_06410 [Elusimicrobia bacterium]|nr:MAG: hypothetical protein A2278_02310 [Elusimicrobia bacterium RIFOXYA12_FULL_49_49]OGS06218.1 MAG: hypothetical protein A2204_02230 [Elusimicrobia bacterium RIFOXYA1_FULL_47_7]OGS10680.1 MAG: hypothetical protein A2386_01355 [Elusimicrobia bacterium RIFOXYB1_FULL_48_9]OGS16880.1 MAG: hypothetical protein A2251_05760 [Elusimicrobia bacterium RIFOXYA2_FULL_47_53]OGS32108.1 MAG: hypothetical protein A2323_08535 [Elusimicrobia bacterium RIFOXYB2_FULL_46_23]HBU70003.1 hypothetical protein [Elus
MKIKYLFVVLSGILTCLPAGLVLSYYHQAKTYRDIVAPKFQMAVFIDKTAAPEVVAEHIVNSDGVKKSELIPADAVFERAIKDSPRAKEILIGSDNPFTPYFIVYPDSVNPGLVENLKNNLSKISGVEEIRYDENIPQIVFALTGIINSVKSFSKLTLLLVLLVIAAKYAVIVYRSGFNAKEQVKTAAFALASGLAGSWVYFLIVNIFFHSSSLALPSHYLMYLMIPGFTGVLLWENL